MFGNTYAIVGIGKIVNDAAAPSAMAQYLRWEFSPADRAIVLAQLKRKQFDGRPRLRSRIASGIRSRLSAARARKVDAKGRTVGVPRPLRPLRPLEQGLLYRAYP